MATKAPSKKKAPAKKKASSSKKSSGSNQCWPGYEHVPGKTPGSKGSCKKKGS